MKSIVINSKKLLQLTNVVAPIVRDKSTLPILTSLLFEVSKNKLKITASNGEIRASVSDEIKTKDTFSFCVSKQIFHNILSSFPNIDVTICMDEKDIVLKSDLGTYSIPFENSAEFPSRENLGEMTAFKVDTELFLDGLKKAIPFVDVSTENLDRILIKSEKKKLNIAGISNVCFYEKEFDYNGDDVEVVLTTDSAKYLVGSIDVDSELSINYNKTFFCVYFDNISIEITQLAVKFPNYKKILDSLPKEKNLKLDLAELSASVKRVSSVSDKDNNCLVFDLDKNKLKLSYLNKALKHKIDEELVCDYSGESIKIGFSIRHLKTILSTINVVDVYMTEPSRPILFVDENSRLLLSPMKFID